MPEQPAMAVGGVDDVHVAPDEGFARGREGCAGVFTSLVDVRVRVVVTVAVFFAGACTDRERGER